MNLFTTRAKKVIVLFLIAMLLISTVVYADNYSKAEIEAIIDKVALERGVPSVFLKAIAYVESGFRQYNSSGTPLISSGNHIGVMQVSNRNNVYDTEKLKYDVYYNINAGVDVLLSKWNSSVANNYVSNVGNMDPNVLENWYFAIWAYNGWIARNNPNSNSKAYQEKIYNVCAKEYNQNITKIDKAMLPSSGNPSRGLTVQTPTNINSANIYQYKNNDLVIINSIAGDRCLYKEPNNSSITTVKLGQVAKVLEGPVLNGGYYWYKVLINDTTTGWIERNWIKKVGDATYGVYPFEDIIYSWCAPSVMKLYSQNLISGKTQTEFCPEGKITREEFCVLFAKVFYGIESSENIENTDNYQLRFKDEKEISDWAIRYIETLDSEQLLSMYGEELSPKTYMTRGEVTSIFAKYITETERKKFDEESMRLGLERVFDANESFELANIELLFTDIDGLSDWQLNNIKIVNSKGLINGITDTQFNYSGQITRGAAASVMCKLHDYINK